jgi:hypothetical protein
MLFHRPAHLFANHALMIHFIRGSRKLILTFVRRRGVHSSACAQKDARSSLFSYTSGRYLFNEEIRLKERYVVFDVEALQQVAEAVVGDRHGKIVSIAKLAEGGFNRVFTLVLQDGFELIAKIPYSMTCPPYFATASEAATLTFLRSRGIPVPEVYAYSATAEDPVGTEYILMEKAPGVFLASKWKSSKDIEIRRLAHSFVELENIFSQIPFSATGSLYFKKRHPVKSAGPTV